MLCYTSGTTGNPKGVLYEHRSSVIHAMAEIAPVLLRSVAAARSRCRSCRCSTPPPGACPSPARWPGSSSSIRAVNDPVVLCRLMNEEKVTHSARRADRLARHVPAYGRDRREARASRDRHHRRLGRAARDDRAADEDGHPRRPRLGDDRDLADRHDRLAARQLGRAELRGAGRSGRQAGPGAVRRRAARRRRRGRGPAARRQELGPAADPRPLGDPPLFPGRDGRLHRRRTTGSTPATSPSSIPAARCRSPTARRT